MPYPVTYPTLPYSVLPCHLQPYPLFSPILTKTNLRTTSHHHEQALIKEHFEVQKAEGVKESIQVELNLKNQISKRNDELVQQQEIELRKLTVSSANLNF